MINLGRLEEVRDIRSVWPDEAHDFTPWLAKQENIEILSETIGIDLTVEATEVSVGDFRADIIAYETDTDRKVLIENQLEDTNHDHLGKLITYAAGTGATFIIWIVKHVRDEHRAAVEWLNNHTDDQIGFFLCEIKLFQIGESLRAPKFEVIEKPNDWVKRNVATNRGPINRTSLPKIKDMLRWGVVSEGDIIVARDTDSESILQSDGNVLLPTGEKKSLQQWLKTVYGWSSVETYSFSVQKKTGRTLSEIRRDYMAQEAEENI